MRHLLQIYLRLRHRPVVEGIETVLLAVVLSWVLRLVIFQAFYIPSRSMAETLRPFDHILAEKVTVSLRDPRRGEIVIFDFRHDPASPPVADVARSAPGAADASRFPGVAIAHAAAGWFERMAGGGDAAGEREFVKRVLGVAGDEIDWGDGALRINGLRLRETYVAPELVEDGTEASDATACAVRIPGRRIAFTERGPLVDGRPLDEVLPLGVPPAAVTDRGSSNFVRLGGGMIGIRRIHVPEGFLYVLGDNRAESADSRWFGLLPVSAVHARAFLTYWPPSRVRVLS